MTDGISATEARDSADKRRHLRLTDDQVFVADAGMFLKRQRLRLLQIYYLANGFEGEQDGIPNDNQRSDRKAEWQLFKERVIAHQRAGAIEVFGRNEKGDIHSASEIDPAGLEVVAPEVGDNYQRICRLWKAHALSSIEPEPWWMERLRVWRGRWEADDRPYVEKSLALWDSPDRKDRYLGCVTAVMPRNAPNRMRCYKIGLPLSKEIEARRERSSSAAE
jgi:hypothetical protein